MTDPVKLENPPPLRPTLSGLLVVDKPLGWSSMAVVRHVRRAAGGVKTGHAGTLDPLATGVVICCLGKATRSVPALMGMTKIYEAQVDLSAFTTTDDREGERQEMGHCQLPISNFQYEASGAGGLGPTAPTDSLAAESDPGEPGPNLKSEIFFPPDEAAVRNALIRFIGITEQTPPAFSAVHIGGKRAYKLARAGMTFVIAPRMVRIDSIELLDYQWPIASLRVTCGKGTYIRSLARDLGKALGTGGHLAGLRRIAVGQYDLAKAVTALRLQSPITQEDLLPIPAGADASQ